MKVTVIGTGYVGLVTGACLAELGNHVICLDVDRLKISMLNEGRMPIHEPGLEEIVQRNTAAGRLQFTTNLALAVAHGTLQFIGVGTPPGEDGSADLRHVISAASGIGRHMTDYKVIVNKSTVPVGTADRVRDEVRATLQQRGLGDLDFAVVSNPEFLKEGAAIEDFMRPDRIVLGAEDERAIVLMRNLYLPFMRNHDKLQVMGVRSAELTKYAANAMLATRISFMNELALLAERVGADIEMVRRGIGTDHRIGTHFLYAGTGYGGSCFPKDVQALLHTASVADVPLGVLSAVQAANERQKHVLVDKIVARFGEDLRRRKFALWGLAFKPNTDDMRCAPSITIITELSRRGAAVRAYDPVAMGEAARVLGAVPGLQFVDSQSAALEGADALVLVTEWKEFRNPDFDAIKSRLKQPLVFDGRNQYDPAFMRQCGIDYWCIGRSGMPSAA